MTLFNNNSSIHDQIFWSRCVLGSTYPIEAVKNFWCFCPPCHKKNIKPPNYMLCTKLLRKEDISSTKNGNFLKKLYNGMLLKEYCLPSATDSNQCKSVLSSAPCCPSPVNMSSVVSSAGSTTMSAPSCLSPVNMSQWYHQQVQLQCQLLLVSLQ